MFTRNPTLIDNHTARAMLEEKYPKGELPHGYRFDAHLATFNSYGWRLTFHRLTADKIKSHDMKDSCEICLTAAELCVLHGVPLITQYMLECITKALSPEEYGQGRGRSKAWQEAVVSLPLDIAQAIEPELHQRLKLPLNTTDEPCDICKAAGRAVVDTWMSGYYGNVTEHNIQIIHGVFGWSCGFSHPSSD